MSAGKGQGKQRDAALHTYTYAKQALREED